MKIAKLSANNSAIQSQECNSIPKILHFIYGLREDFGGKPFSFVHWAAIKSAAKLNPGYRIIFWHSFVPEGYYFEDLKDCLELKKIDSPLEIFGNGLFHVAHQADVVRLRALNELGGIYLDMDTVTVKNFDSILNNKFVMGVETVSGREIGLCNAVMAAKPKSVFGTLWLDEYRNFRGKGRDEYWNEHSVILPSRLAKQYPEEISILPNECFFCPDWGAAGLASMFINEESFPQALVHHLWESASWGALKSFNENNVLLGKSTYSKIMADLLKDEITELSLVKKRLVEGQLYRKNAKLNLGSGSKQLDGYINCDMFRESGADLVFDMSKDSWPIPSDSVSEIILSHALEHLRGDLQFFFSELYRVSCDGAIIKISVPHPRHDYFLIDPTHVRSWLPESFLFLDKEVCSKWFFAGDSKTPLALYWGIDFKIIRSESKVLSDKKTILGLQNILGKQVRPNVLSVNHNNIFTDVIVTLIARKKQK